NPRGSQGYGEAFCTAIRERWGDLDRKDIEAALDTALAQNPWLDPTRLGVAGGSYGGYLTNWLIGHTDRFKAAVSGRCVADWRGMVGSGDLTWNWMVRAGALPWDERDAWYDQQSPIAYAKRITTPLLLEAQEEDHRCPIAQSELVFALVKAYGRAPVRFVRYPGESHGMSRDGRPWQRVHRLREIAAWFERYNP
ncbi:MAG TPA: prolyl oligopeptidase family serine peptidase, partial [Limnochordia bacterium]|nr:prolyl oligopeptidase family serine peptidase [Limnochordia bacterium]